MDIKPHIEKLNKLKKKYSTADIKCYTKWRMLCDCCSECGCCKCCDTEYSMRIEIIGKFASYSSDYYWEKGEDFPIGELESEAKRLRSEVCLQDGLLTAYRGLIKKVIAKYTDKHRMEVVCRGGHYTYSLYEETEEGDCMVPIRVPYKVKPYERGQDILISTMDFNSTEVLLKEEELIEWFDTIKYFKN